MIYKLYTMQIDEATVNAMFDDIADPEDNHVASMEGEYCDIIKE